MLIPPSFYFTGNQERAISLKSKALKFYQFITTQADIGGVAYISRSLPLEDGSLIKITSFKEGNYNLRTGHIVIFGNSFKRIPIEPQFYLYPVNYNATSLLTSTSPTWSWGVRQERLSIFGFRTEGIHSFNYHPVPPGDTILEIFPQDLIQFRFLVPDFADIVNNPCNYIFKVNNRLYNNILLLSQSTEWRHKTTELSTIRKLRMMVGYDKVGSQYAKDEYNTTIDKFYNAFLYTGFGGIIEPGEEGLISPLYIPLFDGLTSDIKVYKRKDEITIVHNEYFNLGDPGELVGEVIYKTIKAIPTNDNSDPTFYGNYPSEVNTTSDPYNFFRIYKEGSGLSRINNPANIGL